MPKIKIQKLSNSQRAKLLRGYGVRVRVGDDHEIDVGDVDYKRILSKSGKNIAHTLRLDTAMKALNKHLKGTGLLNDLKPIALELGKDLAKSEIKKRYGSGVLGDIAKEVAPIAMDLGKEVAKSEIKKRFGKGIMNTVGNIANEVKPIALELGKEIAKSEIKKHYGKGLCKKCGGALLPAGVIDGGALLPAMGGAGKKKRGAGGNKFFDNIGRAIKTSWNAPPASKADKDISHFINHEMISKAPQLISAVNPVAGSKLQPAVDAYIKSRDKIEGKGITKRRGKLNNKLLAYMNSDKNQENPLKYFPTVL